MEAILALTIGVDKLAFSEFLIVFPHADVIVATWVNVSTIAMGQAVLELTFIDLLSLVDVSSNTFNLVLIIELADVDSILKLLVTEVELDLKVDAVVLLDVDDADASQLSPLG